MLFDLLQAAFVRVLQASWQAAVLAAVVWIVTALARHRLSPSWRAAMWGLVFLRLILPALPPSAVSASNFLLQATSRASDARQGAANDLVVTFGAAPSSLIEPPRPGDAPPSLSRPIAATKLAVIVWIVVAWLLLTRQAVACIRFSLQVHRRPRCHEAKINDLVAACANELHCRPIDVVEADLLPAPALVGFIRPILLLPTHLASQLSADELRFVICHELAHAKRRDVLWGSLASVICCIHWFNPLAWMAAARLRTEREAACDERVLSMSKQADNQRYGQTILKLLELVPPAPPLVGTVGMLSGKRTIRRRIAAVAAFPTAVRWSGLGPALLLLIGCASLTGPKKTPPPATAPSLDPLATTTRVYDVRDLLIDVPDFSSEADELPATSQPADRVRARQLRKLITIITSSVDPLSWRDNTGQSGSIRDLSGQLIITQTPENQDRVLSKLQELRGARSVQITVEARFIRSPTAEADLNRTGQHWVNLSNTDAELWPHFLSETEVNAFLAAVQRDKDSTIVTAPRITLFNGQRAYVKVSRQTAYVADVQRITGPTGEAFDPTIATAESGITFDCQATSTDHHLVTLNLRPKMSNLLEITPQPWTGTPQGPNTPQIQVPHTVAFSLDALVTMPALQTVVYRLSPQEHPKPALGQPTTQPADLRPLLLLVRPKVIVSPESPATPLKASTAELISNPPAKPAP